jgi:flavin-dependent dehydrogenase
MEKFLSATLEEVTWLSAIDFYDFIVVGSGIGGGVLTRTLIDESKRQKKSLRVLLIERGGLLFSIHCLNTSRPYWNSNISEGPS